MTDQPDSESPSMASGGGASSAWAGLTSFAQQAVKQGTEQAQAAYAGLQQNAGDLETGGEVSQWSSWAKAAADRAKNNLAQAAEKGSADWGDQAKALSSSMSSTFGKVSEGAAKAGAGLSDVAGSSKDLLSKAGSNLGSGMSSMGALAMSPVKLMQSGGIFFVGMMLITMSLSFLPLLPIAPSKFALLFSLGSMMVLASVSWLKGPAAFASAVMQRDKLPFTIAYAVGLIGTLWATIIVKSYIFTGLFVATQVVGLLYFMASYVPGGKVVLNFFGRLSGKAARLLIPGRK
jgi:hypothetical protein